MSTAFSWITATCEPRSLPFHVYDHWKPFITALHEAFGAPECTPDRGSLYFTAHGFPGLPSAKATVHEMSTGVYVYMHETYLELTFWYAGVSDDHEIGFEESDDRGRQAEFQTLVRQRADLYRSREFRELVRHALTGGEADYRTSAKEFCRHHLDYDPHHYDYINDARVELQRYRDRLSAWAR